MTSPYISDYRGAGPTDTLLDIRIYDSTIYFYSFDNMDQLRPYIASIGRYRVGLTKALNDNLESLSKSEVLDYVIISHMPLVNETVLITLRPLNV